jgi:capsular exopolysaccharide synthesis family protein
MATPTEQTATHLRDYWNIIWRGRFTVLAVFVLVVALAFLRVALATNLYEATALIEIRPEARRVLPGQEQWVGSESRSWIAEELYFNTQLEVLRSRDLAARVFAALPPDQKAMFGSEDDDRVGSLASTVRVSPRVNTRLVELRVTHEDPEFAAFLANELADAYVRRNVEEARESFDRIMDSIASSMTEFRGDLGDANLGRLDAPSSSSETLYVPEDQREILTQALRKYNDELATIQLELGSLRAELEGYDRILDEGGDIMSLPRFSEDGVLQELSATKIAIERDLQRLAAEGKRERHPATIARQNDLRKVEEKIEEQVDVLAEEMRANLRLLNARAASLRSEIRRTEKRAYEVERASTEYELAKTDVESKRRVYDVVRERVEELSMGAKLIYMNNNVAVLDYALVPGAPVSPRRKLILAFGAFLGFVLGIGTVLFLDYLDNTIHTPEDIEQTLGLNVLSIVPRYKGSSQNAVREAYQSLRTSILFASRDLERRVLLMTSAGPQEGKSSTIKNLALSLATSGDRVVVLDCDLRRPTQHKHFEVPREPGLTNYLLLSGSDIDYTSYVRPTKLPNLSVMTCGPIPPNPTDLLGSAGFRTLVEHLKRDFDWVLIDSPPVASIADTVVLASLVDLMVLVIKHNENDRDLIRRSLKRLGDVDIRIAGAVLNSMDVGGGYGSYYTAYDYYDKGTEDSERSERRSESRASRTSDGKASKPDRRIAL